MIYYWLSYSVRNRENNEHAYVDIVSDSHPFKVIEGMNTLYEQTQFFTLLNWKEISSWEFDSFHIGHLNSFLDDGIDVVN